MIRYRGAFILLSEIKLLEIIVHISVLPLSDIKLMKTVPHVFGRSGRLDMLTLSIFNSSSHQSHNS